ncbi:DUF4405 domain-containing protein [Desulfohalobiaceae bacterium Ax17]|uniref:DUF4405 domain-containing protein n=1 Tax=Desulfovulcanus ferrireducens TaxID=2831190 RepID=UPI00207BB241|nr:DUF4405 domain-containing protein [Desulfovulcanus ferrireducens]MBT8764314.1 DUF4405 domain-containing protein [Desulfovulcanus ferrireducens]
MNMRRITSLTAFISFFLILLTSIVLYIVPHGRVAYWSDWRLWGLSKEDWANLHINLGFLFLISLCLHIYYNWKPIITYLKNKASRITIFNANFTIAFLLTIVVSLGTYFMVPPFSTIINISESIKEAAARKYGQPPYGHAELSSVKMLCQRTGLDLQQCLKNLKEKNIVLQSPDQTILEIARKNGLTPKDVYLAMKGDVDGQEFHSMPSIPPSGLGRKSLGELCKEYKLDLEQVLRLLKENGYVGVNKDLTLKDLANKNRVNPMDIYMVIRQAEASNR